VTDDKTPPAATTVSAQYDEHGADYFSYQVAGAQTAARISITRFAPYIGSGDRLVDFGCGTGWLLKLANAGEKLGIEPNPVARQHASELGINTVAGPAEVEDGWADVVISNHALEHSLSPFAELQELFRIVRPGGRLVLCLPLDDWRQKAQRKVDGRDPNHHLFTWTPLLLTNLLQEVGFDVRSARAFTYLQPYYNEWLFPRLPRPAFDALARVFGSVMRYRQVFAVADRPR
jgi:SAM-dependent methyltransferase